jgi:hypothetical protein
MIPVDEQLLARIAELEHQIQVMQKRCEEYEEEIAGLMAELGYDEDD